MTCALDRLTPRQRAIVAEAYRRQLAPLRIDIDAMALRLVGVDDATARVIVAELARSLTSRLGQVYRHPPRAACEMFAEQKLRQVLDRAASWERAGHA